MSKFRNLSKAACYITLAPLLQVTDGLCFKKFQADRSAGDQFLDSVSPVFSVSNSSPRSFFSGRSHSLSYASTADSTPKNGRSDSYASTTDSTPKNHFADPMPPVFSVTDRKSHKSFAEFLKSDEKNAFYATCQNGFEILTTLKCYYNAEVGTLYYCEHSLKRAKDATITELVIEKLAKDYKGIAAGCSMQEVLEKLPHIKKITIRSKIPGDDLQYLKKVRTLEEVKLLYTNTIGETGLSHIWKLENLKRLSFDSRTSFASRDSPILEGFEQIKSLTNLEELRIGIFNGIHGDALKEIGNLKKLRLLWRPLYQ